MHVVVFTILELCLRNYYIVDCLTLLSSPYPKQTTTITLNHGYKGKAAPSDPSARDTR